MLVLLGIGVMVMGVMAIVVTSLVVSGIKRSAHNAANRVLDRTLDKAFAFGEKHLDQGIKSMGEVIDRELTKANPEKVAQRITQLAKQNNGEVMVSSLVSELEMTHDEGKRALQRLAEKDICYVNENNENCYIFPAFKTKKMIKI
ncbi:MAG: hypothetical protein ACLFQV_11715, partial [Vulcanimicrobiota bacterium]